MAKTKVLISFVVTTKLICVFVFAIMQKHGFPMTRLNVGWLWAIFFRIFEIIFCFIIDIFDLVHDVGAIFHLA